MPDPDTIEALVARGAYAEAAARAEAGGDMRRAIELYERVWRFADAIPLARAMGDRALAVRLSLDAGDPAQAGAIAAEIADGDTAALERAARCFADRGHHGAAALLVERAGHFVLAAEHFRRAGESLEAGRCLERAGSVNEAGRLYETTATLARAVGDERSAALAQLALGRLLGNIGLPRAAARALQDAARYPQTRALAQKALCADLLALGLRHAAAEIARRLCPRASDPLAEAESIAAAERAAFARISDGGDVPRRFRVLRALGAGALARVYAAWDELSGRTVALKVLAVGPGALGPERAAFTRFLREAEAAGRLRDSHIVAVHEIDEASGLLVLEHMPGGTLAERLATGRLAPGGVRRLGIELLAALSAAHRVGIVHRDVKPANVFFDAAGSAKLGDFGAAHLLDFGHTRTGSFIGTLAYLSPEQITGAPVTAAADQYGLGATLYEALTGRPPFLGPDIAAQHLSEEAAPPSTLCPDLLPAHDEVVLRALSKVPSDRYPSADAMAEAIRSWSADGRSVAPPAPADAPSPPEVRPAPPQRRDLGRTVRGRLVAANDPRTGRDVLIEELDEPLDDAARDLVRRLAAAGGPHVQRVLALSSDDRSVTYELVTGDEVSLADLSPQESEALSDVWPVLEPLGLGRDPHRRVTRSAGGLVVVLVERVSGSGFPG